MELGYHLPGYNRQRDLFYLYLIMDVFSRKIVGWEVYEAESVSQASMVFRKACLREGIAGGGRPGVAF